MADPEVPEEDVLVELSGPKRAPVDVDIDQLTLPSYLLGFATKVLRDIKLKAGLYDGVNVKLYKVTGTTRCKDCIDSLTGSVIFTQCATCGGTGYASGYSLQGKYIAYFNLNAREDLETPAGNTDNSGGSRDSVIFPGMPLLKDTDLLYLIDTGEIYCVEDQEPQVTSMQGYVILQSVMCARITPGRKEYAIIKALIDAEPEVVPDPLVPPEGG